MKRKVVIINILVICLLLFNRVEIKADSDDNLYMNAYQATLVAMNRKTQESINMAREVVALLPKHLDWAIGEFSRKLDTVQNPILANIVELINIANITEKQDDINRARLAIPTGLPKEWLNTYSSAIDGIQNRLIAKTSWAFQVLKVSKLKSDAIVTRGLVNEVKKVDGNPGVQTWIKAIENELDTFIDSILTINIKATTIPKGTPLVDILDVKNLEDKDIKNKYKVDYEVSDKGVIDDKGVFNPLDDVSVFIKVKVLDVTTPVTLINIRKAVETELQGFSIEDEWDVSNNAVYSSLEMKKQNIKVGEVNKKFEKIFSICASGTNIGQQKSRVEIKYKNHTLLKEFTISVEDSDFYKQDHEVYVDEIISFGTSAVVKVYEVDKNRNRIADVTGLKAGEERLIQAYLKNDVDGSIRNLNYASNVDGFTIENNTPKGSYKLVVKRNGMEIAYKNIKIK